jgi:glc operon protein GlcG
MPRKICFALALLAPLTAMAQPTPPAPAPALPYGAPIGIEAARRAMLAAEEEATRNNWGVVISIVDSGGHTVMVHRLDNTQLASIRIAEGKARTALEFRRATKLLEDIVANGGAGMRLLSIEGATVLEGGVPIVAGGRIIGAIGVSGVLSSQDAQVARAGAEAVARDR